jgi:glycosyltransferase involved in cell wall biosynthesis
VPKVSIGLPVYNGEKYLEETLQSLVGQTFTDFELIISDNDSTDRTRAICERYAAMEPRIRYYRNETNRGAAWNFNRVFQLSRGEYFKWAAHDDLCAKDYLEKCVAVMEHDLSIVLCHSKVHPIDAEGKILPNGEPPLQVLSRYPHERHRNVLQANMCYEIFGLIRSCILRHTPLMGNFAHGDGILLAWLGLWGRFYEIPEYLFFSRRHREQAGSRLTNRYMWAEWFDPAMKGRIVFPHWRMLKEYLRAIFHVPMARGEKIKCLGDMVHWMIWHRRRLLDNLIEAAKKISTNGRSRLFAMSESGGLTSDYGKDGR